MPLISLLLILLLVPVPAAAGTFSVSLPADSAVKVDAPSRLDFRVTNTDAVEGLSRLTLRFASGYRVKAGSPPSGWTVEGGGGESGEITFRTTDEAKCTGSIARGSSLVFGVEVVAPASRSVTPDGLASAQAEQSCRGMSLDPPGALPSWGRLGIEGALGAGPPVLGLGGTVTATLTVFNLSTVELADVSALLQWGGTAGVSQLEGPTPATLTLAPGGSGSLTWTARASGAGTLQFSAQALSKNVTSSPVWSDTLLVGDLDVSLSVTPEQVQTGGEVQVQLAIQNLGPARVTNVVPLPLGFEGTATPSAPAGPSPASLTVLEPGESGLFTWAVTVTGVTGDTYSFSSWATAEMGTITSAAVTSNQGSVAQPDGAGAPAQGTPQPSLGGGGVASSEGSTSSEAAAAAATAGSGSSASVSATLQFVAVNQNGSETGGTQFSGGVVRDLKILVAWQNLAGSHSQRLDLFAPDGSLYQRLSAQFTGSGTVQALLPVGGSWITQHSLYGAWGVEVFLDSARSPSTNGAFVLNP